MRRTVALMVLLWVAAPANTAPLDVIRACAESSTPATGLPQLEKQCPQLEEALNKLDLSPLLTPEVRNKLTGRSLQDFVALTSRYEDARPHAGPRTASLQAIAAAVNGPQASTENTWLGRLKTWVNQWIERLHLPAADWLNRWLDRVAHSNGFLTTLSFLAMALVVLAAIAILLIELRAAGFWRLKKRTRRTAALSPPTESIAPRSTPFDTGGVADLFNRIVICLMQSGRLPRQPALTHRELVARSALDTPQQHQTFAQLAGSAELLFYGPPSTTERDFGPIVTQAEGLLKQLAAASSP